MGGGNFRLLRRSPCRYKGFSESLAHGNCQRHLERVTSAVVRAGTPDIERRNEEAARRFKDIRDQLDGAARRAYRALVETPGFADVVALSSPLEELG